MYYVIHVKPRCEQKYIHIAARREERINLSWPRRRLRIRSRGVWRNTVAPIFSGYVFLQADEVSPQLFWTLRRVPGFLRFLKSNENIVPLSRRDQDLLEHFLSFGQVVDRSLALFDETKKIKIVAGPLKGLEGSIAKVDRRKGRARVKLDLYEDAFFIDFGFQDLEQSQTQPSE